MALTASTSPWLNKAQQQQLLALARSSIEWGLESRERLQAAECDSRLQTPGGCFVTLHSLDLNSLDLNSLDAAQCKKLRGCIGSLEAQQALGQAVADAAYGAAFEDPRFAPVIAAELAQLVIDISVLTPSRELTFTSDADLLQQLTPYEDGLTLSAGKLTATFLPSVWELLPDKQAFLRQLKLKAGFNPDAEVAALHAYKYQAQCFTDSDSARNC